MRNQRALFFGMGAAFLLGVGIVAASSSKRTDRQSSSKPEFVTGTVSANSTAPFRGKLTIFFGTRIGNSYSVEWLTPEQAQKARENPQGYIGPTAQRGTLDPAEIVQISRFDGSSWVTTTA